MLAGATSLAFTDTAARPYTLTVDGLMVVGGSGKSYGVNIESIELTHAGPGQVSALSFTLDDPLAELTLRDTATVRMVDEARDVILFTGFVTRWVSTTLGLGRSITVECAGIEAILDWLYCPIVVSWNGQTNPSIPMQAAIGASVGPGGFDFKGNSVLNATSNLDIGIGFPTGTGMAGSGVTIGSAGPGSLRSVLTKILNSVGQYAYSPLDTYRVTVDMYGSIRGYTLPFGIGTDMGDVSAISLSTAGASRPAALNHEVSGGDATRSVYITGGNAAGSGMVSDATGFPGEVAQLSDSNSLDADYRNAIGRTYLARRGATRRGSVRAEELFNGGVNATSRVVPGCQLTLTDAQAGLAAERFETTQFVKRFHPSKAETWEISYGAAVPSGAQYLRALTRAVIE